ncbi:MAG: 16S rRNA (cytosine(967)-C(5))-methyltransferase RsmB [Desulfuromonadales bacterium]
MTIDPRRLAFDILERVQGGSYADRTLDAALQRYPQLDPRDRGLATELVYGVLRQQGRLDYALGRFSKQPLAKLENRVLLLLRLGAYQLLCLDRVPDSAAVDTTVKLTRQLKLERATGFINGILRALGRGKEQLNWPDAGREPLLHLQHALSLPAWLAERWLLELGAEEAQQLAAALLEPAPFSVRVNTLKIGREQFLAALVAAGHRGEPTRFAPEGVILRERSLAPLPGDIEGWYQVQDEASMLVAHLLAPQPGEHLLDVCAAPGGKTTHLAALTGNRATITALDLHPQRLRLVEQGAARLGCSGITAHSWDMTLFPPFLPAKSCDGVLVDAPCSGLGVLRRNPEARWRLQPADVVVLAERQAMILNQAAALVKPGGRLVYAVCTLTPEETDRQVADFLARHPDFRRQSLADTVPDSWRELLDDQGCLRSWPHRFGLDGFFAARLIRG